jgi:NAD(P)-dependent dehydrogenase (short-subunit alcohol dehydrogenase family)
MDKLEKKVVLITGAGKGSGRILAGALAKRGAAVAANDISPINVEEAVDEIIAKGGRAKAYIEDVAKKVGAQSIVKQVEDDFGRIDILINHAAVEPHIPLLDMDEWDWHRVLDVNLTGAFLMTQSAGRVMRVQGSGVIINLIHGAKGATTPVRRTATLVHRTAPLVTGSTRDGSNEAAFVHGTAALVASMNGLDGLTHAAARELDPYGIRVYSVGNTSEKIVENVLALLDLRQMEEG